jgi:hypothetical protein
MKTTKATETKEARLAPILGLTPAGGQINSDWADLCDALVGLTLFLDDVAAAAETSGLKMTDWHVVFRCGTMVRIFATDPEFPGYDASNYRFPGSECDADQKETVKAIMADNVKVWENQKVIPGVGIGKAVRQAYAKMLGQGYPYPGGPAADRSAVPTGIEIINADTSNKKDTDPLWFVLWPNLDALGHVYNLAFAPVAMTACALGGTLRRYDYMFPEVAAVFTPERVMWAYGPDKVFRAH